MEGRNGLRTAAIAEMAATTESTIYRHFNSLPEIIEAAYRRACQMVVDAIARSAFSAPSFSDPVAMLMADTGAIWAMKTEPEQAEAALVAFLFFRRRQELLGPDSEPAPEQIRLQERFETISKEIVKTWDDPRGGVDHAGSVLSTMVLNYCATVWMTWFTMPTGSTDVTADVHDLSADEAQMGVAMAIEFIEKNRLPTKV